MHGVVGALYSEGAQLPGVSSRAFRTAAHARVMSQLDVVWLAELPIAEFPIAGCCTGIALPVRLFSRASKLQKNWLTGCVLCRDVWVFTMSDEGFSMASEACVYMWQFCVVHVTEAFGVCEWGGGVNGK